MASTDALPVPRKGAAFRAYVEVFNTSGTLVTGGLAGVSCQISKDGGTYGAPAGAGFTEIGTTGTGYVELNSTDTNADHVRIRLTVSNTDACASVYHLYCEEAGDIRVNLSAINSSAALLAKFAAAVGGNVTGTVTGSPTTEEIQSADVNDAQADLYNGRFLLFLTGALAGKATKITDYEKSGSNGVFAIEATPIAASSGNTFLIL